METLKITKYGAFRKFKKNVGNNNHFLITSLIGINKLDGSDIGKVYFASWNPENLDASKVRSEEFVKKAALAWGIDCFDELLKDFFESFYAEEDSFYKNEETYEVYPAKLKKGECKDKKVDNSDIKRSVYLKYSLISGLLQSEEVNLKTWRRELDYRKGKGGKTPFFPELELVIALADVAIQWRNNLVHSGVRNPLMQDTKRIIKKHKKDLESNEYGTLDVDRFLKDYSDNNVMSFKELAVLTRNLIDFGYILNAFWVNKVDKKAYLEKVIKNIYIENDFEKIKVFSHERKKSHLIMLLRTAGVVLETVEMPTISNEEVIIEASLL